MRDTQGERQQPDDELVDELEDLAAMLLERGRIAASVRDSKPPATDDPRAERGPW